MPDIRVYGTTIPEAVQTEVWTELKLEHPQGGFSYLGVQGALMRRGFNGDVAYRGADRMLQTRRRLAQIRHEKSKWFWT